MKKFLKVIGLMCLAIVLLCPLALAGCSKNHTITISVEAGSGNVFLFNQDGISVLGKNAVKGGKKFEFFISPNRGYYIEKILLDDEEQTGFDADGYYMSIDNVKKNHDVKVYFGLKEFTIRFLIIGETGLEEEYESLTINVKHGSNLDLNEAKYGGENNKIWYIETANGQGRLYLCNGQSDPEEPAEEGYDSNVIFVRGADINIHCGLHRAELEAKLSA